jgi:uncharacterized membrane protein YsdA (DUF1294 family)
LRAFIIIFLLFNLFTFLLFGYDKFLARTNKERISERTLFWFALAGGSVGAIFAQKIFRHKSKKYPYAFWIILVIEFVAFEAIWYTTSS